MSSNLLNEKIPARDNSLFIIAISIFLLASIGFNIFLYFSSQQNLNGLQQEIKANQAAVIFLEQENKALKLEIAQNQSKESNKAETISFRGKSFDTYTMGLEENQFDIFST